MRALVLGGSGGGCRETTIDLANYSDIEEITVTDNNVGAVTDLLDTIGIDQLNPLNFNNNDYDSLLQLFPK